MATKQLSPVTREPLVATGANVSMEFPVSADSPFSDGYDIASERDALADLVAAATKDETAHRFAKDQLRAFIERVERLEEEKKALSDDVRDVYAEAKGVGYDVKALRAIVRLRKMDADERREQETILDTYKVALGMA